MAVSTGVAAEPGIYADFETSLGDFTCRLEYTLAPKAVANFIGLATGERAWIDQPTGAVRTAPFYDGLTFHRVMKGFMIQGGSPNGQGTDGPGYAFPDEFSPELRHDGPGVLSMANSGPSSNGAQFFVTVAATAWLNDVHTIFGRVVSGMDVVTAISVVPTDATDHPTTPVVVSHVTIRREGPDAMAFDLTAQGLPVVTPGDLAVAANAGGVDLDFASDLYVETFLREAGILNDWSSSSLGIDLAAPILGRVPQETTETARFFAISQVHYPESTRAPRDVEGRELTIQLFNGTEVLTVRFDEAGGGTFDYNGQPGTVSGYTWTQEPYRGRLWPIEYSGLVPMTFRLDFTSETGGTYSGTAYTFPSTALSGDFTLSTP
ncbi:MAG: peptidylprolyl isomerase [Verrucomicrobiales bacterium]|nr:peptidylprolyl isomerase [Verrucomicrobiales bacterium]